MKMGVKFKISNKEERVLLLVGQKIYRKFKKCNNHNNNKKKKKRQKFNAIVIKF